MIFMIYKALHVVQICLRMKGRTDSRWAGRPTDGWPAGRTCSKRSSRTYKCLMAIESFMSFMSWFCKSKVQNWFVCLWRPHLEMYSSQGENVSSNTVQLGPNENSFNYKMANQIEFDTSFPLPVQSHHYVKTCKLRQCLKWTAFKEFYPSQHFAECGVASLHPLWPSVTQA